MWAGLAASLRVSLLCLPCRKRKILVNGETAQPTQEADLDAKQALMPVQEYNLAEPLKQQPGPQRPGDVVVQWKDGTVTSLYTETSEEVM